MNSDNSTQNSPAIKLPGIAFPWFIALLGALLLSSAYIYNYTFGVFFKPLTDEFGWSRVVMSGAFAIRSLACAVFVVPMGYWADRYGPRRILLPCFILLGLSMMAVSRITTIWQLYLAQGAGIGIGMSGPFVCIVSTVAKWHDTKRGLALGIASAGIGLSSILFPPIATRLIETMGWQFAIVIMGIIILAVGIPASMLMRDPPNAVNRHMSDRSNTAKGPFHAWAALPRFLRDRTFLTIIIMFLLIATVGNMLLNHLVNYATDIGMSALVAAEMMSVMGVASTLGRLGMGAISDRIGTRRDAAICCILMAVAFIFLVSKITALIWVAAALFGVGFGGSVPLCPAIMGERVDIEELSTATGIGTMGMFLGSALGPALGGFIYDVSGSYLWALLPAAGISIVAFVMALRIPLSGQELAREQFSRN